MKKIFLSQLKPALKLLWKNRALVALCGLFDIIFFTILGFLHYEMFKRLKDYFEIIMAEMQKTALETLQQEDVTQYKALLAQSAKFMSAYHQMMKYVVIFFLLVFVSWLILKGINWYIANRIVKKKVDFKKYFKYFTAYSLLWFVGLIAILILMVKLTSYSATQFLPIIGQRGTNIITAILILILAYFAFISFSLIPKVKFKEVFKIGVKKWREIIPAYIIVLIITFLAGFIPFQLSRIEYDIMYWLTLAFTLLISIPALTYGRIYILLVINKVVGKNG